MERKMRDYEKLPVYQKAQELFDLVEVIAEALKEDDMKESLAAQMISNAALIQAKIAGAEGGGLYSLRMQNAVLIKLAAQDMFNAVSFASMVNINEEDYVQLMREKVDEFRLEFIDWIRGFDKSYDIPDNWAIRFDTSTPEQEKLEELMFDEERFFEDFEDEEEGFNEDGFEGDDDEEDDDEDKLK
ncbi:hypothetical protein EOD41_05795 [Mucilaginibacter limnophilus]|uniref:Four helix bundle protein n=1 Tax=Mucilaginibacter limnophilus TaxID=1932778 RepID=A0A3S2Y409_9SPHI|nr:hypothetical protein [Mucilaginibacter limnophilus]RVU01476.1 hypothetical protein EOD41_05795 [Mucilaginibacter limnophilus]